MIRDLIRAAKGRIMALCTASCSCGTKTPEVSCHNQKCHFRLAMESADAIDAIDAALNGPGQESIVAAAIKWHDLLMTLPAPARHADIFDMINRHQLSPEIVLFGRSGFLSSSGRFVDRKLAAVIAHQAGQIDCPAPLDHLSTQDLW